MTPIVIFGFDDFSDGSPFQSAPLLGGVVGTQENDDQPALTCIDVLQVGVEIRSRQLGLIIALIVRTGGSDLERAPRMRLRAHVGEIGDRTCTHVG